MFKAVKRGKNVKSNSAWEINSTFQLFSGKELKKEDKRGLNIGNRWLKIKINGKYPYQIWNFWFFTKYYYIFYDEQWQMN